jgi:hypothetical protein
VSDNTLPSGFGVSDDISKYYSNILQVARVQICSVWSHHLYDRLLCRLHILIIKDKWFHTHPELSFCEKETAAAIVKHLETFKAFDIHPHIGGHGLAAVLKNGEGKTLLLRADIDALPVQEQTGLEYASTKRMKDIEGVEKPVMHACGQ